MGKPRLRTTHKSHTLERAEPGFEPRSSGYRSQLLTTTQEGRKGMPVRALSRGQLAKSSARKEGKGRGPQGLGCPQAARSGNRTFPTFSARIPKLMSQGCQDLHAPWGRLREAQPENTSEGLFPLAPVPSQHSSQKELNKKATSFPSWKRLWGSPHHQSALGTLRTNQGPLRVLPLRTQG